MSQRATLTGIVLSISTVGAGFLLYWAGISGADVSIFHVLYLSLIVLLALMCAADVRSELVVASLSVVLAALWIFPNASYVQPVLYNSDLNTEWRIVQYLVSNSYLPQLTGGTKISTYAMYPALELIATSLQLVAGVAAYDFLTCGGAFLSGISVLLALTFYRRLLPQRSLATSAFVVASFSVSIISYGSLAIHETLALVFVCLALVGLSLRHNTPFGVAILFGLAGLATVVSHILTSFLFLLLITSYAVSTWILKRLLNHNRQTIQRLHLLTLSPFLLLLYATTYLTWNAMISTQVVGTLYSTMLEALYSSWGQYATYAVTPGGVRPVWMTALAFLGFGSYGLITLAGLFVSIRSRLSKLAVLVPIALSSGAIFLLLYFAPISPGMSAVQPRSYMYAYLFGAPLFVVGLRFVSTRKPLVLYSRVFHARVLPLLILALVLSPTVYYGVPWYLWDRTSPLSGVDTRLGFAAEYGTDVFVSRYSPTPQVLAVDIVVRMDAIRIYAISWYVPSDYHSVADMIRGRCLTMIIRQSITRVPDSGYGVSTPDYEYLLKASNVLYSSGDPLVLYTTYCASSAP
jgi:hypothetical protein